jgi:ABC-type branched-subunit amino acid transport system substrate-binding protein
VVQDGGECVGVTDGSFIFIPSDRGITEAEQAIAGENAAAAASKQGYVTVALLDVLTQPPSGSTTPSDVTVSRIRDELRGAYVAQYHANHELGLHPEIRLLLANEGSGEQSWRTDWNQLRQLPASGSGELVAVAGMGLSVQPTVDAAHAIGDAGIGMFGAVTTADTLDSRTSSLIDRVVPAVSDEVTALARYLPKPSKSVLVYDGNTADLYTKSLRADFKQAFGPSLNAGAGEIPYAPSTLDNTLFKKIAQDLCAVPTPPLVFYAGRNSVFDQFVSQLEQEGDCNTKHLTIVTGGDADGLPPDTTTSSRGGAQVSVVYADIENPNLMPGFTHDFQILLGREADSAMTDPWLLASYDAVTAAANAIEDAEGSKPDPTQVKALDVTLWVGQLNRSAAVAGATGTLQISANGDLENPAIPIIKLAAGRATILTVVTVK